MSRTRNERKRDALNQLVMVVLISLIWLVYFAYCVLSISPVGQPEKEQPIETEPAVRITIVENELQPSVFASHADIIPYIPDEVAQQEARMPEFGYDYEYVMRVVAAESRGEPYEGQLAVAQCIRETSERTMMTPEEVVKQVNKNGTRQYAQPVDISVVTESVRDACCDVFVHGVSATDEPIRYFYSTASGFYSAWHENSLEYVMTIGNHRFFKEK